MRSNEQRLRNCRLYLILDTGVNDYPRLLKIAQEALEAGVDIMQLRDKKGTAKDILSFAERILKITRRKVPFIINDRVDLALLSGSDGVHLGQDDVSIKEARKILGDKVIIGASCQSLAHLRKAERDGADYVGYGTIFRTLTKPEREPQDLDRAAQVIKHAAVPAFAIGGIGLNNISQLKDRGIERVSVCRAISGASNIRRTVKEFKKILNNV